MKTIQFNKLYKQLNITSIILIVVSLFLLMFKGLNFGVDFKGGTLIEIRIEQSKIYMKTTDNTTNIEVRTQTTF